MKGLKLGQFRLLKQYTTRHQFYILIKGYVRDKPDGEESCQYRSMKQIKPEHKIYVEKNTEKVLDVLNVMYCSSPHLGERKISLRL
jgi:hypothetical protein